jgi:hypothetical protein
VADTITRDLINDEVLNNSILKSPNSETEYLSISNDIHSILTNCPELDISQKLEYCNSQRYFMKMYLKEMIVKLNLH